MTWWLTGWVTNWLTGLYMVLWQRYMWYLTVLQVGCLTVASLFIFCGPAARRGLWPLCITRFLYHTHRRTTVVKTPLDEWSARRRDLYLTIHNAHNKHPCPPVGFEPTIAVGERPYTYALCRAATGTGPGEFLSVFLLCKLAVIVHWTERISARRNGTDMRCKCAYEGFHTQDNPFWNSVYKKKQSFVFRNVKV
jgi:hypothetical protein